MELLALLPATVDPSEAWMIVCYAIGLAQGLSYGWLMRRLKRRPIRDPANQASSDNRS